MAGSDTLGCGGCSMFGGVFQSLDHLPLDGSTNSGMGGASQMLCGAFQGFLALSVIGVGGTALGRFHHLGRCVGKLLRG